MPGYIMHLAEANLILKEIQKGKDEIWQKAFVAGNLLPDTKKKAAKVTSHFWNPNTLDNLAIPPDLDMFLKKYGEKLDDPIVLGYYAHLYLDERFVNVYWNDMVTFYDDEGQIKKKKEEITKAKIGKTGQIVSRDTFFSAEYYYGDYSKLNNFFVEKYHVDLDKDYANIEACIIEEVDKEDLHQVLRELKWIMKCCDRKEENHIKVFSIERLCAFLEDTAKEFADKIRKEKIL